MLCLVCVMHVAERLHGNTANARTTLGSYGANYKKITFEISESLWAKVIFPKLYLQSRMP